MKKHKIDPYSGFKKQSLTMLQGEIIHNVITMLILNTSLFFRLLCYDSVSKKVHCHPFVMKFLS